MDNIITWVRNNAAKKTKIIDGTIIPGEMKMSRMKQTLGTVSIIIFITNITFANWKENAKAIDISGGEDHTLVLTKNRWVWGCGNCSPLR